MGEKYRPSNGSEGSSFISHWCDRCERDRAFREGRGDSCSIVANTLVYNVGDPEYPEEWTWDKDGVPICTAFVLDKEAH